MLEKESVCGGKIKSDGNGGGECLECGIQYLACMIGKDCHTGPKKDVPLSGVVLGL